VQSNLVVVPRHDPLQLSQGDIEKRTGLVRPYISSIEHNHSVPTIETLEKMAQDLEIPMYQLFYDGVAPPKLPHPPKGNPSDEIAWGSSGKDARFLSKIRRTQPR
jgi:transcriptional regulator with XRE-family HTH domain